jgi:hypothetical protein
VHCSLTTIPTFWSLANIQYFKTRVQNERTQYSAKINYQQSLKIAGKGGAFMPQKYDLLIDRTYARMEEAITDKEAFVRRKLSQ